MIHKLFLWFLNLFNRQWYVVTCYGQHIYASRNIDKSYSLANRLAGSLGSIVNNDARVRVVEMKKDPTVWPGLHS